MENISIYNRVKRTLRRDGFTGLVTEGVPFLWNHVLPDVYDNEVRPMLPATKGYIHYNGVIIDVRRLFDSIVLWQTMARDRPDYEAALVKSIRQVTSSGDSVAIIGGGWGVSTVVAANLVGDEGTVSTFEGAKSQVRNAERTARLNAVSDRVDVRHAIIGEKVRLRGDGDDATIIPPEKLPECDTLVLDCDGAELPILEGLTIRPEIIVVEHHAVRAGDSVLPYEKERLLSVIESLNYQPINEEYGKNHLGEMVVVTAKKRQDNCDI